MLAAAVAVAGLTATTTAQASPVDHDKVVSSAASDKTPHVLEGRVESVIQVGGKTILGGVFTQVQNADRTATFDRNNLVAFDTATGEIDPLLSYSFNNDVYDLVPAADGRSFYVAGAFWRIDGKQNGRLARIDAQTGEVMSSFKSPGFNNAVTGIELSDETLYVGGSFTTAGSSERTLMASLDASTGAITDEVDLTFSDIWSGTTLRINDFVVSPDGSRLYAAGNFRRVAGLTRSQIVQLDLTGPTAVVGPWSTTRFASTCVSKFEGYIKDIDISSDGSWFAAATTGAYSGGPPSLCDAVSRWEVDNTPNAQPTWVNYSGGDTLTKVTIAGDVLYLGGHQRWVNNPYRGDAPGPGAIAREGISAHDVRNGMPYSWDPGRTRGVGVYDFLPTTDGLWVGSDTDRINWLDRGKIAFLPFGRSGAIPAEATASLPGEILSLSSAGATAWAATPTQVGDSRSISSGAAWSSTRAATVIDDVVYHATSDGTLLARSFDGNSFGDVSTVDLLGLTDPQTGTKNFAADLRAMGSMFFDRTSGRLYFTLAGTDKLFYRYFTTETRSIGAQRFEAAASGGPVSWSNTRGAFISGNYLYYSLADGTLNRVSWTGAGVAGAPQLVSGPATDGKNWSGTAIAVVDGADDQKPVAVMDVSCDGLACEFDASGSSDPEGKALSYAWSFGDGASGTGVTASHTFGAAGTFSVSLTVTDPAGNTNTATQDVVVREPVSGAAFVASSQTFGQTAALPVPVPAQVQAGDVMLLLVAANQGVTDRQLSAPDGWTSLGVQDDISTQSQVWWRTATAEDAGTSVTVSSSSRAKLNAQIVAYTGLSGAPIAASAPEPRWTTDHTTPELDVPAGAWAVSFWTDNSAGTTDWTVPSPLVVREMNTADTSSGSVSTVTADSGGPLAAGTYGAITATADTATGRATMWTIALPTDDSAPDQKPVAVMDVSCDGLACEFDASGSSDPEGKALSYAWSFGDGASGTGVTASHTFGAAGTFSVSLTVTDPAGNTNTATQDVVVREPVSGAAFVASSQTFGQTAALPVPVPAQVQAGDVMLLLVAANQGVTDRQLSAPDGWTSLGVQDDISTQSQVWWRTATAEDAGTSVTVSSSSRAKLNAQIVAYTGLSGAPIAASAPEPRWTTDHTTPELDVPAGAWAVSFWTDNSAGTTDWTVPSPLVVREMNTADTSSGSVSTVTADSGGPLAAGTYGAITATADTATGRATMWTIALPTDAR